MKKYTTMKSMLILSVAVLTSVVVTAQTTPSNNTSTYRLMKTNNQSGERVLYKDGEKVIIKEGESNPYGTSRWETDVQGNKILVIRRHIADDSIPQKLSIHKGTGEKVLFNNGEKIVIKEGENSPLGTIQSETDEQGNEILVMRKNAEGDSTTQRMMAYKIPSNDGERVLYKNGEKINIKNDENIHLQEKGEWKTDDQGRKVFVIQKDSSKTLYIYPDVNGSNSTIEPSENIRNISESLILYPNPTPAACNILYKVEKTGTVLLELVDMEGRTVSTLLNEQKESGSYILTIDLSGYNNGTYFVRYTNNGEFSVKKLLKIE